MGMNYNQPYQQNMYGDRMYPNFYQPNQFGNQYQYQQFQQPQQMIQPPVQQMPQVQGISGKYVDSIDVVKATEVPMGGSSIFPKADLSEIYIKSWNNDGTTKILTFIPVVERPETSSLPFDDGKMESILSQLSSLNKKLDKLSSDLGS